MNTIRRSHAEPPLAPTPSPSESFEHDSTQSLIDHSAGPTPVTIVPSLELSVARSMIRRTQTESLIDHADGPTSLTVVPSLRLPLALVPVPVNTIRCTRAKSIIDHPAARFPSHSAARGDLLAAEQAGVHGPSHSAVCSVHSPTWPWR